MKKLILAIMMLFIGVASVYAYTPQEAKAIYDASGCKLVKQLRTEYCVKCTPTPYPECAVPVGLDVITHWVAAWDGIPDCVAQCPAAWDRNATDMSCDCDPVTDPTDPPIDPPVDPTPTIQYPIVLVMTDNTYISEWTISNGWATTTESGRNLGVNTVSAPVINFPLTVLEDAIYYIWVRGEGDTATSDSISYGIDGYRIASITFLDRPWSNFTQYSTTNAIITLTAGSYDLNIWMREDGTRINEIRITTDSEYIPQ